jgi:hypothetical protein
MLRTCFLVLVLYLGFVFQGCAALEYFDGSSREEIVQFRMTREEMWNEMKTLQFKNANLGRQLEILREQNQRITDQTESKIAEITDKNAALANEIRRLEEENKTAIDENRVLAEKVSTLQHEYETLSTRKLRVKVLTGDGNLNSAIDMARKLESMGYTIGLIDHAPRSNFSQNTVFFASKSQHQANCLVTGLGDNTISKPLSWSSVFDLIVVTGKRSMEAEKKGSIATSSG